MGKGILDSYFLWIRVCRHLAEKSLQFAQVVVVMLITDEGLEYLDVGIVRQFVEDLLVIVFLGC